MKRVGRRLNRGRADPFGLLVLLVMLALFVTMAIQAQAASDAVGELGLRPVHQQVAG